MPPKTKLIAVSDVVRTANIKRAKVLSKESLQVASEKRSSTRSSSSSSKKKNDDCYNGDDNGCNDDNCGNSFNDAYPDSDFDQSSVEESRQEDVVEENSDIDEELVDDEDHIEEVLDDLVEDVDPTSNEKLIEINLAASVVVDAQYEQRKLPGKTVNQFLLFDVTSKSTKEMQLIFDPTAPTGGRNYAAEFDRAYSNHATHYGTKKQETKSLFQLLQVFLPHVNFPLGQSEHKRLSLDQPLDPLRCEFDVCINGCTLFIDESEKLLKCHCGESRFEGCKRDGCNNNADCDPFNLSRRGHGLQFRIPKRNAFYRSIVVVLKEVVKWSNSKDLYSSFFNAPDLQAPASKHKSLVGDISFSERGMFHKAQMKANYDNFVKSRRDMGDTISYEDFSFIMSEFYDGGTLFKRQSMSVWPLFFSILNCDPKMRMLPGVGLFLNMLHDMSVGCPAEEAIFLKLLVPELNFLHDGISFKYTDEDDKEHYVFLQARLICHIMDTPAWQKKFKLKGCNSKCGCRLCNLVVGISRKNTIDRICNFGYRGAMPNEHISRRWGLSGNCCDKGYYKGSEESVKHVEALFNNFNVSAPRSIIEPSLHEISLSCDNFNHIGPTNDDLFNAKYKWENFSKFVHYPTCCFTERKPYKRFNNEFYETNGRRYDILIESFRAELTIQKKNSKAKIKKLVKERTDESYGITNKFTKDRIKAVKNDYALELAEVLMYPSPHLVEQRLKNKLKEKTTSDKVTEHSCGCGGRHVFSDLKNNSSAGIESGMAPDTFHSASNTSDKLIKVMKGTNACSDKIIKQSLCEGCFSFIEVNEVLEEEKVEDVVAPAGKKRKIPAGKKVVFNSSAKEKKNQYTNDIKNTKNIPWLLMNQEQKMVDWRHNCILIPAGLRGSYYFTFIFKHTGYMKGNDKIKWLTSFITFDIATTSLPNEYKNFMSLMSELMRDILQPTVTDVFIADLFMRTVEALCIWEGMLPHSEQYFAVHELIDIVAAMRLFGPVRGWWALAGERMMSKLKSFSPKGGEGCLRVIFNRFVDYEHGSKDYFTRDLSFVDCTGGFSDNITQLTGDATHFNSWTSSVRQQFHISLFEYLDTLEIDDMFLYSPYYRIYTTWKRSFSKDFATFGDWVDSVVHNNGQDVVILPASNFVSQTWVTLDCGKNLFGYPAELCREFIVETLYNGMILEADLPSLISISEFIPQVHRTATIKGVQFRGRGEKYCESLPLKELSIYYKSKGDKLRIPSNELNDLVSHWHFKRQRSGWFKFKYWQRANLNKKSGKQIDYSYMYGQMNVCFQYFIPNDPFLDKQYFANVTTRKVKLENITEVVSLPYIQVAITTEAEVNQFNTTYRSEDRIETVTNNYHYPVQFVCLDYVESLNVAVVGVDVYKKPILTADNSKGLSVEERLDANIFCCTNPSEIDKLYLIDLQTNREDILTREMKEDL